MKRADVIFGMAVLLICAVWLAGRAVLEEKGACVTVERDGELYGSYPLDDDLEVDIGSGNHISIKDGSVRMTSADCPDHICIRQGKISAEGAVITCLPNRVTVRITGDDGTDAANPDVIVY